MGAALLDAHYHLRKIWIVAEGKSEEGNFLSARDADAAKERYCGSLRLACRLPLPWRI
jgi:hypothetical protein